MSETKTLIFTTISMAGGGTERVIATLANYYASKGMSVHILMLGGREVAYALDERIALREISGATGGSLIGRVHRIRALRSYVKKYPEAQVIAMGTVASMFTGVATIGCKNKLVVSERNDPNRLNHRPIKRIEKIVRNLIYTMADCVVFQTPMAKELFPEFIQKKSKIILNPLPELPEVDTEAPRENVIIAAGRLTEQKNMQLLIRAFAKVVESGCAKDYQLKIYGQGELENDLRQLIDELGISNRAHLMGFTAKPHEELMKSKIYVSSSNWEGISNSLMEAMALGCAVIATDCPMGGSAMLIKDRENGILTPIESISHMETALHELMSDERAEQKIRLKACEIRNNCKVEIVAKEWLIMHVLWRGK